MSHLQGPILHRLNQMGLLTDELTEVLFRFFCICVKEPVVVSMSEPSLLDNDQFGTSIKEYYMNK